MPLSNQQIKALLDQARHAGLMGAGVHGLELFLYSRGATLDGAGKLDLTERLATPERRTAARAFQGELEAVRKTGLAQASASIMGMSDAEWDAIMNGEGEPDAE